MFALAQELAADFFGLFYPNVCVACSNKLLSGEKIICFRCLSNLPQTNYWKEENNPLIKRFWGRVPLQNTTALFHFHKGNPVQHLLHQLKYNRRQDIGEFAGKYFGEKLKSESTFLQGVELIVPVPLHWKKQKMRGYNQCNSLAKGLSESSGIAWSASALLRNHENISQTKKKRFDRWGNVSDIFSVKDEQQLIGKHILLVDDVVTTGATGEACLQTILKVADTKVSFAAIAAASK